MLIIYCTVSVDPSSWHTRTQHAAGQEFVDVEEVASEVHDAERDRLLRMDVSSDEGDVVPTSRASARGTRATRSTQPRVQSAALSVNTGRMVRLRRPARSATSRSSRAQRAQREASPPTAPAERVGNFSWSAVDAAGFEAQPSSSSRPDHLNGESLPGMLDVPLSPDRESPLPDREIRFQSRGFLTQRMMLWLPLTSLNLEGWLDFHVSMWSQFGQAWSPEIVANAIVLLDWESCGWATHRVELQQTADSFCPFGFMPSFALAALVWPSVSMGKP